MPLDPILALAWERALSLVLAAEQGPLTEAAREEVARVWRSILAPLPPVTKESPWASEPSAEVAAFLERYAGAGDTPECAADLLGLAEWILARDLYADPWGGPFNGQARRREMIEELERCCRFAAVVETGTFRGSTTEWLADARPRPVVSFETSPRFHRFAQQRLATRKNVRLGRVDSRQGLDELARKPDFPAEQVLFYLDAHWGGAPPIAGELEVIGRAWRRSVVVIDDFQVPDDPGFGWDDYGEEGRLSLEGVALDTLGPADLYWPSTTSALETGARRGCLVVTMAGALPHPATLSTLRLGLRS